MAGPHPRADSQTDEKGNEASPTIPLSEPVVLLDEQHSAWTAHPPNWQDPPVDTKATGRTGAPESPRMKMLAGHPPTSCRSFKGPCTLCAKTYFAGMKPKDSCSTSPGAKRNKWLTSSLSLWDSKQYLDFRVWWTISKVTWLSGWYALDTLWSLPRAFSTLANTLDLKMIILICLHYLQQTKRGKEFNLESLWPLGPIMWVWRLWRGMASGNLVEARIRVKRKGHAHSIQSQFQMVHLEPK